MRRVHSASTALVFMLVVALVSVGCGSQATESPSHAPSASPDAVSIGYAFVAALAAGDGQSAQALEDTAMLNAAPAANLLAIWQQLLAQYGGLQTLGRPVATSQPPYINVSVPATFAQATVTLLVTVSTSGQVAGFHVGAVSTAPPSGPAATPTPSPAPASYVDPSKFTETAVTVGSSPWALPGTLSMPNGSGPFPAVVLIAGSGPADRDETFGPNKPLRDLAWGLASAGIAVLRYDKRTDTYDALMSALPNITVKQETMDDVVAAVTLLRSTPDIDTSRVFLVGHSLGAYLAPRIAAQLPGQIDGLAMLEDFSTPLPELILNQARYLVSLTPSPGPSVQAVLANLEAQVQRAEAPDLSASTPPSELPLDVPASYWLDLRTYDPIATVTSLKLPMFFSQGGRDYQVPPSELQPYQAALSGRDNVVFNTYPAMDHLLLDGTGTPSPAEYNIPGHVDAQLVADLAAWITAH